MKKILPGALRVKIRGSSQLWILQEGVPFTSVINVNMKINAISAFDLSLGFNCSQKYQPNKQYRNKRKKKYRKQHIRYSNKKVKILVHSKTKKGKSLEIEYRLQSNFCNPRNERCMMEKSHEKKCLKVSRKTHQSFLYWQENCNNGNFQTFVLSV